MGYLDVKSLLSLSRTSSQFYALGKEEKIWKYYFSRDFGDKSRTLEDGGDWRSRYSEEWKKEREMRRRRTSPDPRLPMRGGIFPHVPIPDFSNDPGAPAPLGSSSDRTILSLDRRAQATIGPKATTQKAPSSSTLCW